MLWEEKIQRTPVLEGKRLKLMQIENKDAARLLHILSDPLVIKYVTQGSFFSFSRSRRIASELLNTRRKGSLHYGVWLPDEEGLAGVVSLQRWREERREAMVGYMLGREFWGRGLATEALCVMLQYAFTQLKLQRVEGSCHAVNVASEKVMQKNGMKLERAITHKRLFFASPLEMKVYFHTDRTYDDHQRQLIETGE